MWCLGKTYAQLGDYNPSSNHLQEIYRLSNTFPLSEVKFRRLGGQCGGDLMDAAGFAFQDYDEVVLLAWEVETKCAALSDDVICTWAQFGDSRGHSERC